MGYDHPAPGRQPQPGPGLDPQRLFRLASVLTESAAALRRLAPGPAEDQQWLAEVLAGMAAMSNVPTVSAQPAQEPHSAKSPRLSRHRQSEIAISWFFNRREQFKGKTPPSEAQDIKDARNEIGGVSRDMIQKHRPVEWKLGRGEKPKSPNS